MLQRKLLGLRGLRRRQTLVRPSVRNSSVPTPAAVVPPVHSALTLLLAYTVLAALVTTCWLTARLNIQTRQTVGVHLQICHNRSIVYTNTSTVPESPTSLRMKLVAVYLAHELNRTTLRPIYTPRQDAGGASSSGGAGAATASAPSVAAETSARDARRIWTHPQCDPDGDGEIADCDISAPWKYRQQLTSWIDLGSYQPNPFNPSKHLIPPGEYRFVVVQLCLENLGRAPAFSVQGGQMESPHAWGGGQRDSCVQLTRPFASPFVAKHGDEAVVSLWYHLEGTFRTWPLGTESKPEWECFGVGDKTRYCVRLPGLQPEASLRSENEAYGLSAVPMSALCRSKEAQQLAAIHQQADLDGSGTVSDPEFDALRIGMVALGFLPASQRGVPLRELDASADSLLSLDELWSWAGVNP